MQNRLGYRKLYSVTEIGDTVLFDGAPYLVSQDINVNLFTGKLRWIAPYEYVVPVKLTISIQGYD